ncbi:hypothetical protein COV11_03525 [Candidatus Woesearchaeota archaeon CG10_big_fil_rev_8_21_14_0_10_30_7]|nr:MAG: hypothetical protein COV11_03525 [Candidatus Woesearchaeota archaeon CG10_big_fil_rev_8_21_14_0_10_30_7]
MINNIKLKTKQLLDKTNVDDIIIAKSKKLTEQSLNHAKKLKEEIKKNIITAITAAFGFMIALAWRDAIQDTVNTLATLFGFIETAYLYKFVIAMIITVVCVAGLILISKFNAPNGS